jgi:5'-3' exoribonuclease 1
MGIPRFFKYISNQFPNVYSHTSFKKGFICNNNIDNLYLDANGIIHNCVREIYFPKRQRLTKIKTDQELLAFQLICNYIDNLLMFVKPQKLFYIAIDGPAPLAKQGQQRQRRYRSVDSKTTEELKIFDTTSITPGTEFMYKLSKYIKYHIMNSMTNNNNWSNIKVILSGSDVPGEGEHKIVNYIRNLDNKYSLSHCMYGLDADLFMLSLASHCDHFYLLREDQFNISWDDTYFYIVDIGLLKSEIENQWGSITCDRNNLVDDFIFVCFLVGNDFLHSLPPCYDLEYSINFIMDIHKQILQENYITKSNGSFNLDNLNKLLTQLMKTEEQNIAVQFYNSGFPNITLHNSLKDTSHPERGINFEVYKKLYYKKMNINYDNKEQIWDLCKHYLQGLDWVNYYYHNWPKNWLWFYPYHYSPLITDIVDYMNNSTNKLTRVSLIQTQLILPFQQLLCVVPPKSKGLLPKFLQPLYNSNELKDIYPENYNIDYEGKLREWEGIALLPFIDFNKILSIYNKVIQITTEHKLPTSNHLNVLNKSIELYSDYSKKYLYKSSFGDVKNCIVNFRFID